MVASRSLSNPFVKKAVGRRLPTVVLVFGTLCIRDLDGNRLAKVFPV